MGLFISFEGGEGSGKSTQAKRLWERLRDAGCPALLVQEPGSTPLGWALRNLLKSHQGMAPSTELALFAAARAELVEKVIKPELTSGTVIVADRYLDSTVAYQGYGRRLPVELINTLNAFITQGLKPTRTFLLDLDSAEGLRRLGQAQLSLVQEGETRQSGRADQEGQRRFEEEPLAFHRRVRQGYLALAKAEPQRFVVLDASKPPEVLEEVIWKEVSTLLANASLRS
ncbi:MAG: dTMP kinase [Dehalococcoidia bacterium]|nr:dTMP kinase [Dehalococcoidia bacterium]